MNSAAAARFGADGQLLGRLEFSFQGLQQRGTLRGAFQFAGDLAERRLFSAGMFFDCGSASCVPRGTGMYGGSRASLISRISAAMSSISCLGLRGPRGLEAQFGGGRVFVLLLERLASTIVVCRYCHALNCWGISSLKERKVTSTAPMVPPAM